MINSLTKLKKLFKRKTISIEKVQAAMDKAVNEERERLKKIHGQEVSSIIDDMYADKQLEIESIKSEMRKIQKENERLKKRNEYLENLYYKTVENAKVNSIVTQEISTDAKRLLDMVAGMSGLIHGINDRAQNHFDKMEKDKMKVRVKLDKLGK